MKVRTKVDSSSLGLKYGNLYNTQGEASEEGVVSVVTEEGFTVFLRKYEYVLVGTHEFDEYKSMDVLLIEESTKELIVQLDAGGVAFKDLRRSLYRHLEKEFNPNSGWTYGEK